MKHSVVNSPLAEIEARPPGVYEELVKACLTAATRLREEGEFTGLSVCPACGGSAFCPGFAKSGYSYLECEGCWSILATPRPSAAAERSYQHDSAAATLRRSPIYTDEVGPRLKELARSRAERIAYVGQAGARVVLVQPRSAEILPELARLGVKEVVCVDPLPPFQAPPGALVDSCSSVEDLAPASWDVIAVDDVLEHTVAPSAMLQAAYRSLKPGGTLVASARCASGFDIQILWEHADVFPLEHITLLSVEGMRRLLDQIGFQTLELSTPGLLDLQVIERVAATTPAVRLPRFLRYMRDRGDRAALQRLQVFLQENLLSSHMRVLARRPQASAEEAR